MDDRELVDAVESCTLPGAAFDHRSHLRLAWIYLREAPLLAAAARFSDTLRRYATSLGAASKFHATITCALMFVMHERMRVREETFDAFLAANPDLLDWKALLARYYSEEVLASDEARAAFVLPDIQRVAA